MSSNGTEIFVSVVAPLRDDGAIVEAFVDETAGVLRESYRDYELVLVDDGSTDDTLDRLDRLLARHQCVRVVRLSRSFGEEVALAAGLDSAIGDYVVTMLPDSDPPELIPRIVEQARTGAGVVFGIRETRAGDRLAMRVAVRLFHWLAQHVLRIDVPRNATQFRAFSRQALNAVLAIRDSARYLRVLAVSIGYANRSFRYRPICRGGSPRRKSLVEAVGLAIDLVVTGSRRPLRLVTWFGAAASAFSLLYSGYVILVYLFKDDPAEGWTTLSLQVSVMFFFLFVALAVVSEYIGHILAETRNRPLYHVLDELNSCVLLADPERRNVVVGLPEGS